RRAGDRPTQGGWPNSEFLPTHVGEEVEIALISLASVTGDLVSIRARRSGTRIVYRIEDGPIGVGAVKAARGARRVHRPSSSNEHDWRRGGGVGNSNGLGDRILDIRRCPAPSRAPSYSCPCDATGRDRPRSRRRRPRDGG